MLSYLAATLPRVLNDVSCIQHILLGTLGNEVSSGMFKTAIFFGKKISKYIPSNPKITLIVVYDVKSAPYVLRTCIAR